MNNKLYSYRINVLLCYRDMSKMNISNLTWTMMEEKSWGAIGIRVAQGRLIFVRAISNKSDLEVRRQREEVRAGTTFWNRDGVFLQTSEGQIYNGERTTENDGTVMYSYEWGWRSLKLWEFHELFMWWGKFVCETYYMWKQGVILVEHITVEDLVETGQGQIFKVSGYRKFDELGKYMGKEDRMSRYGAKCILSVLRMIMTEKINKRDRYTGEIYMRKFLEAGQISMDGLWELFKNDPITHVVNNVLRVPNVDPLREDLLCYVPNP